MTYQLRRMVLINAGTNMHVASGRITAIDPRGGAAVLGDNGVGKTTTLRILPLFFGHLPSQIVSAGQGQEPMIRFVLPNDTSAVAFEYQRGSEDAKDIRLAVIRRRHDDPDLPYYRLYRSGFRKELFVDEGRFLSDEETQQRATLLDIQTTSKLTTADYRSVILRTSATSKDKEKLRRYSIEWSFGPKQLDNLDRLVAAMVKKHINFGDIVQVAVGLVQHDLGQGAERKALIFKQGRAPIERWLKTRDACADAFKLAPAFEVLEDTLKDLRGAEAQFRLRRADVLRVTTARKQEKAELSVAIAEMERARGVDIQARLAQRVELAGAAASAQAAAQSSRQTYDAAQGDADYLHEQRAAHWEVEMHKLPSLRISRNALDQQVTAAEAAAADATRTYLQLEQEARRDTGQRALELEQEKEPYRKRFSDARERIDAAQAAALKEAADLNTACQHELTAAREPLIEDRGRWDAQKKAPAPTQEARDALARANDALRTHAKELATVTGVVTHALDEDRRAKADFAECERDIRAAKAALDAATSAHSAAVLKLTPLAGTFLARLREHGDDAWKRTLAKVINPDLLERDDLDPQMVDEAIQTVYGWQLSTCVFRPNVTARFGNVTERFGHRDRQCNSAHRDRSFRPS